MEKPREIIHAAHVALSHGILLKFPDGIGLDHGKHCSGQVFFLGIFNYFTVGRIQPHMKFIVFREKNKKYLHDILW